MNRKFSHGRKRSRGAVLFCVLACMAVVSGLLISMTKSSVEARREVRIRAQMRQTELLLDAGINRAATKLDQSPDYKGETWTPTDAIEKYENATVQITVSSDETKGVHRIKVIASLGADKESETSNFGRTQRQHTFNISINPSSTEESSDE